MSVPNEKQIREAIKEILKNADLSSLSSKKVRKSLEEKFVVDLTEKKQQIDDILMQLINADDNADDTNERNQSDEDGKSENNDVHSDNGKPTPVHSGSSNGFSAATKTSRRHRSSSENSDFDEGSKQPVTKKQKSNSTKNNSKSKGSDRVNESSDDEVDDEALARKLHEEELGVRPRSSKRPEKKPKRNSKGDKDKGTPRRKGTSLYSQACVLSEDLASIMGTDKMARKDVVSKMWQIFKERNLMDPKNKQYVICDEQLEKVFTKAFGMMKILKNHIKDAKLVQS